MAQAQVQATTHRTISSIDSIELVRCLLRVSVFHVTSLRGLFPDSYFREIAMRNLDGIPIKILQPVDDESKRLLDWIDKGVFEAVKLGYLKTLVFGISSNAEGTDLLEEYVYSFSYGPDGALAMKVDKVDTTAKGGQKVTAGTGEIEVPANNGNSHTNIKYQVTRLIRMLIGICKTLEKVPKERYLFCRLVYHDHTPEDYEPDFFRSMDSAEAGRFSRFPRRPFTMQVGSLTTEHHQCSLRIKSILDACGDEGDDDDGENEDQGSGQFLEEPLDMQEECPSPMHQAKGSQGLKTALPRQRAQEDLNDLMSAPQELPTLAPEPAVAGDNMNDAHSDDDVTQCPETKAAAKASSALAQDMHGLAVGKKRAPREPASENNFTRLPQEDSDMTVSPSKATSGGRAKTKRAHDVRIDQSNPPPDNEPANVYYDASQQSGLKAFKRTKTSVVTDPIHQTAAKKKMTAVSPKATPAGGRARLSRMRC